MVEAQFQIEAPDPYPPNKVRTDLGMLVVLSSFSLVTYIEYSLFTHVNIAITAVKHTHSQRGGWADR